MIQIEVKTISWEWEIEEHIVKSKQQYQITNLEKQIKPFTLSLTTSKFQFQPQPKQEKQKTKAISLQRVMFIINYLVSTNYKNDPPNPNYYLDFKNWVLHCTTN